MFMELLDGKKVKLEILENLKEELKKLITYKRKEEVSRIGGISSNKKIKKATTWGVMRLPSLLPS